MTTGRGRALTVALIGMLIAATALLVAPAADAARLGAVDNDAENKLWDCETRRVPFGNTGTDVLRCFTYRFSVPAGGVTSAYLHLLIRPDGQQDTDALVLAVDQPFADCDWGKGKMAGCVMLHGGLTPGQPSLNINLLDIACDSTVRPTAAQQDAVRRQLNTGVLHFMLQDDTAIMADQLVLNEGPAQIPCGSSASPTNPATAAPVATTAAPVTAATASGAVVAPERATFAANETIRIQYSGFPGATLTDWISIAPAGSPDTTYANWFYLAGRKQGTWTLTGIAPGSWEIRGYFNWSTGGYTVRARGAFTVTAATGPTVATAPPTTPPPPPPPTVPPTSPPTLPPTVPPTAPPTVPPSTMAIPNDAEASCQKGDIDNLGFGFPAGFDVFSGRSTPAHAYPWTPRAGDAAGTDRIMVGSGATRAADGYAGNTSRANNRPQAIDLECRPPAGMVVRSMLVQLFIDDFQSPAFGSRFTARIGTTRWPQLEAVLNAVNQTGPIGKLVTVELPADLARTVAAGRSLLLIDDATTGVGDGYAIDFVRVLINPRAGVQRGGVRGRVLDAGTGATVAGATVRIGPTEVITGTDGSYAIGDVPAGLAVATASASGFGPATGSVDVITDQTSTLDLRVTPSPPTTTTMLAPTTTRAPTTTTRRPTTTTTRAPTTTRPPPTTVRATTSTAATPTTRRTTAPASVLPTTPLVGPTTRPVPTTGRGATSTSRTPTTTRPGAGTGGDCDGNGRVDEADALCALQMSVELIPAAATADVDGRAGITSRDAAVILRRATGRP